MVDDIIIPIFILLYCIMHQHMSISVRKQINTLYRDLKIIRGKLSCEIMMTMNMAWRCVNWLEAMQREAVRMGCRDQTESNISCTVAASLLRPHAHPAHSHVRTPVISAEGCSCTMDCDMRVTVGVSHSLSPSFIPLLSSFCFLLFLSPNPNPSHPISIFVFFSLPLVLRHKSMHMHPSIRPHTRLAQPRPWQAAQFDVGLCKEILKSVQYHCLTVSPWQLREQGPAMQCQTHRGILNLSKQSNFVCWWSEVIN